MLRQDISLINKTLQYLGCSLQHTNESLQTAAKEALDTINLKANFKYRCCKFTDVPIVPAFVETDSYAPIRNYLPTSTFFAGTLGLDIDKLIKSATKTDLSQAVILNAAANVTLEEFVNQFITSYQSNGSLFCPGYAGTDIMDNEQILNCLNAKKLIGIYTAESGIMIPEKSMCGIILTNYKFSCTGCFILQKCKYRKQGTTCYNQ